jgi:phage tail protein X
MSQEKYTSVRAGETIDQLAYRVYGDSHLYRLLLDHNPDLDIWDPITGQLVKVVDPNAKQGTELSDIY